MAATEQVQAEQVKEEADAKLKVQNVELDEAVEAGSETGENLGILLDIQMSATVVLGNTKVPFKRLLQLSPGSVLKLDKSIGQPAELYVQDILLATGDIVVVDDCYGIRIREITGAESVQDLTASADTQEA
jgi:flagellar motor switch protein FliN/FliY